MRKFLQIFFTLILIFTIHTSQSQFRFDQISGDEGLSHNTIRSVIQDKDGFIWVGTYNGVNKYDGYTMQHYRFSNDKSDGLSSNIILSLFEDISGNIWAGTTNAGLNRIDPKTGKVTIYFNDPNSKGYANEINEIFQNSTGIMFVKYKTGIKIFKVDDDGVLLFDKIITESKGKKFSAKTIFPSLNGNHWVFTPEDEIILRNVEITSKDESVNLEILKTDIKGFQFIEGYPVSFFEYPKNTIWVLSNRLQLLKLQLDDQLKITNSEYINLSKNDSGISMQLHPKLKIAIDKNKYLWMAGGNVLINYDISTGHVYNFNERNNNKKQIIPKQIQDLLVDHTNILWIGTQDKGLYKLDLENHTFYNSTDFISNPRLSRFPVTAISEDKRGNIWFGLQQGGGLVVLKDKEFKQSFIDGINKSWNPGLINKRSKKFKNSSFFEIKRLLNDSKDNMWVGAKGKVSKVEYLKSTLSYNITTYDSIKDINGNKILNTVFALEEDSSKNIWVGYWIDGLVKMSFDKKKQIYTTKNYQFSKDDPKSLSNNYVRDILEDKNKNIWVGTIGGLNKVVTNGNGSISFDHYLNSINQKNSLSNNYILDLFETKNGTIYIGTYGGGLNKIEFSNDNEPRFKHYTTKDGLPSDVVFQIREDFEGNLWMQHIREISRLNPKTGEIIYFDNQDGFTVDEFKDNAMHFTSSGIMICGGVNGFTFFKPNNISVNRIKPQLTITDFKLFNESVEPLEKIKNHVVLQNSINDTEEIKLPYFLNSMEFVFSSLHFSNPEKNQYKYILEGFTDKWQYSKGNERRFASYTNVPPGKYTFKVYGSNSTGVWTDNPKQIKIIINPPWYLTLWAILLFILLAISIIYLIIRNRSNQIRLQSELELESALHEKSDEINQMKLQFFTNISHELRTPLTLIIGPLQQIMQGNANPEYLKKLNTIMYKNSVRLLKLINQLLDFRKAESGKIKLAVQQGDLVDFVKEIFNAFEEIAIEKDIKFLFISEENTLDAWFDNDKIEKILYNLLSNSFKFTPKGKSVKVILEKVNKDENTLAVVKVIDYGIGIPEEELESIFERFYQTKKENSSIEIGSGLGLAYIKHLVEIHKGEIQIDSELHRGTVCTFSFPISKSAYDADSIIESQLTQYDFKYIKQEIDDIKVNEIIQAETVISKIHDKETPTLLIVEDNKELQGYINNYFSEMYNVITANNGEQGLELANRHSPNIIISDLMMPIMDGIEMCKKIKTDIRTSHIPVVILTAKTGLENEKEGLETGADEFILKPFNIEILRIRIENILKTKQQWIQRFQTDTNIKTFSKLSNKLDQQFLKKSIDIIKKNIDNPEFTVETFASEIAMSRSALFKKLKSVTGQSTTEFIRSIKLKRAIKYLKSGEYSITEVIFMVGFSDPKYFRTCFKKQFGVSPSQYIKSLN